MMEASYRQLKQENADLTVRWRDSEKKFAISEDERKKERAEFISKK